MQIKNFALIDDLSIELGDGFNVLTGETGAGKSIIIDAITAILGERISSEMIRTGADKAVVEAAFDLSGNERAHSKAAELGFDMEDGMLLISREISSTGKSQCRINGRLSTISMLKELTSGLIDVHGQHEHQWLLDAQKHLDILDQWCGPEAVELRSKTAELYSNLRKLKDELEQLKRDERERARLLDLYEFQRNEIEAAKLSAGEDEELMAERSRLANAEKLHELASEIYSVLSGSGLEIGASDLLSSALSQAQSMAALDESLSSVVQDIETALYAAEQAQTAIRAYRDDIEFNPEKLEAVEERLDLIRTLKRKYGDTIEEINAYGAEVAKKIEGLANSEERAAELTEQIEKVEDELLGVARRLSDLRKVRASEFAKAVEAELADLAMSSTRFDVSFTECEPGSRGIDAVEFVISPNPGEPLKPLAKIASGGETSRVMLALKTVAAGADKVPTLIFDEIDTGIGGRTAQILGQKLAVVAQMAQVMCVTHLPQIASRANHHYSVEKSVKGDRTLVSIRLLKNDDRVDEIARMLGGTEDSQTAAQHAREMLEAGYRLSSHG
ncbi:MAG TPA: DNA repair protein RecN [Armatimonadota bacterium]|nr:DNA repair protein RecN [Armatimonadota bacterium]